MRFNADPALILGDLITINLIAMLCMISHCIGSTTLIIVILDIRLLSFRSQGIFNQFDEIQNSFDKITKKQQQKKGKLL